MAKEISARFRLPVVAFIITATFIALFGSYITYPRAQSTKNHSRTLQKSVFKDGAKLAIREDTLSTEFLRLNTITGQTGGGTTASTSDDYTCGPGKECSNGSCCGESGWCGYNSTYCGDGCQSNCDAKAECGQFAASPGQECPIHVCCSPYGFCGTTAEFCGTGCQSNCDQPKPSVDQSDVQQRIVAYYEGWNIQHSCGTMAPEEIPVEKLTHLIVAFGYITPDLFLITNMDGVDPGIYERVANMKQQNPDLKVMIALGGWSFTDPGEWQNVFTSIVSNEGNRAQFITNLIGFLGQYGFDGVDFDWEYPGASDRGGTDSDGVNYTTFLKELRSAVLSDYILTFTAPTSYWYLQHFDLEAMTNYVDWINFMAYDLHGVWDSNDPIGSQVLAHTNLTEIDLALDLYWRNNIHPSQIVLGLGFYGRTFHLVDPTCWKPGCAFAGAGAEGPCTATAGILSYKEITDILSQTNASPYYDEDAAVNYFVYGDNNWISFDNAKSYQAKIDYANKQGLGGLMVWAIDQDNTNHDALNAISPLNSNALQFVGDGSPSVAHSSGDLSACKVMEDCGQVCDAGWTAMTRVGTLPDFPNCPTDNFRYVCCPSFAAPSPSQCYWNLDRADGGLGGDCNGGCKNIGDISVVGDSWGWVGPVDSGESGDRCDRGGVTYCCPAGNMEQYLNICTWTECGAGCPSDKPWLLGSDVGGTGKRCPATSYTDPNSFFGSTTYDYSQRSFCCPSQTSFRNCNWYSAKECSEACPQNQIEIDQDAGGPGGYDFCGWGRTQKFCCDPPEGLGNPFSPVDLVNLFPPEYLPAADAIPQYDLVSFGGYYASEGNTDPSQSGIAFILFAGSQTVLSRMRKRENAQNGIEFIDCPENVRSGPSDEARLARIICLGEDVKDCFPVRYGGVEGTLVTMPPECGDGFARAISLEFSKDQSIPESLGARDPTSAVFDFTFDYDMPNIRRDSGSLSMRVDYSNVAGYWSNLDQSPGMSTKRSLAGRYFSPNSDNWSGRFQALDPTTSDAKVIKQTVSNLLYYQYSDSCPSGSNGTVPEGLAIGVHGEINLNLWYGYSMIGTIDGGTFSIHEADGFVDVHGYTDMTFEISGLGIFDATSGRTTVQPLKSTIIPTSLGGHSIMNNFITFDPFVQTGYTLGTSNSVSWNGYANARMITDFSQGIQSVPTGWEGQPSSDEFETGLDGFSNEIDADWVTGGDIGITHIVDVGLAISMSLPQSIATGVGDFPTMIMHSESSAVFIVDNTTVPDNACLDIHMGKEQTIKWTGGSFVGWDDEAEHILESNLNRVDQPACFSKSTSSTTKRAGCSGGVCPGPFGLFPAINYLASQGAQNAEAIFHAIGQNDMVLQAAQIVADQSYFCEDQKEEAQCCGCIDMDAIYGPDNAGQDPDYSTDPYPLGNVVSKRQLFVDPYTLELASTYEDLNISSNSDKYESDYSIFERGLTPGGINKAHKDVLICYGPRIEGPFYPSYPKPIRNIDWKTVDGGAYANILLYDRSSESCSDWDTQVVSTPRVPPGSSTDAEYNTEHVFEGQTISYFFEYYISLGRLPWFVDKRKVVTGDDRFDCTWVANWVSHRPINDNTWSYQGEPMTFGDRVIQELGSFVNPERLVVFPQRPNINKGALYAGNTPLISKKFGNRGPEAQLLTMKELGMVFTYQNIPAVMNAFCLVYEGIYALMGQFDAWYPTVNPGAPAANLQVKWQSYVRDVLDNVELLSHITALSWFFAIDWAHLDQFYVNIWNEVIAHEVVKMHLEVTCTHLPPTTLPVTGFLSSPRPESN